MTNINNTPAPPPVNAEALLTVTPDGLEASIIIKPPENDGADLSYAQLKDFLTKNRIAFGIDEALLISLSEKPEYDKDIIIANGIPPEDGENAELIYHIETNRQIKPKEKADGSVDFKDLGTIQEISKDYVLCEKTPATPGKNGTDVKGLNIKQIPGKDIALPEGKNTVISEDKLKLLSAIDGHVTFLNGKISVLNTFVIDKNVSIETGNINFSGNVIVRGDVAQGFSIMATGDVTIEGVVEAATVIVGGNLIIKGGFLGASGGALNVAGNAVCRFIEGGQVTVKGNFETTYIMNASVKCGGSINLVGKGLIRGSYISARSSVTANFIGSPKASAINTVIEIGNDPFLIERLERLSKENEENKKNVANLELMIAPLEKGRMSGSLSYDKFKQLEKATALLDTLTKKYKDSQEQLEKVKTKMSVTINGAINIKQTVYTGVKLIIGPEMLVLQNEYDYVSFIRNADGITFLPLIKE